MEGAEQSIKELGESPQKRTQPASTTAPPRRAGSPAAFAPTAPGPSRIGDNPAPSSKTRRILRHVPPITLMVQGTTSDAGKTTLVAGLARVLRRRGAWRPFAAEHGAQLRRHR